MQVHYFAVKITRGEWLKVYRGTANRLSVVTIKGKRVLIPTHHFIQHIREDGLHGLFRLELDRNNRFVSLLKLK